MDPVDPGSGKSSELMRTITLIRANMLVPITTEMREARITVGIRTKAVGIMENFTNNAGEICQGETKITHSAVMQK